MGKLTDVQIEDVLKRQTFGRLGCYACDTVYIVPISFVYDGKNIYCHSLEGKKITMMRENPEVCFELEIMENMGNWKSVVCWGRYQELTGLESRQYVIDLLLQRLAVLEASEELPIPLNWAHHTKAKNDGSSDTVMFRIAIKKKTGRFEQQDICS